MTALGLLLHLLARAVAPRPAAARPQQQRRRPSRVGWILETSGARRQEGEPWIARTSRNWWAPARRQLRITKGSR